MCGRYLIDSSETSVQLLLELLEQEAGEDALTQVKVGEIFPTNRVPILVQEPNLSNPSIMTWGFSGIPKMRDIINARLETVAEKPMFRKHFLEHRCVVPASGFYEWSGPKGTRVKHLLVSDDPGLMYMAGIWRPQTEGAHFVILTREARGDVSTIHHRMPVLLDEHQLNDYLSDPAYAHGMQHSQSKLPIFAPDEAPLQLF